MRPMPWAYWPMAPRIAAACLAGALLLDLAGLMRLRQVREAAVEAPLRLAPAPVIAMRARGEAEIVREAALRTPFDADAGPSDMPMANAIMQQGTLPPARPRLVGTVVEGLNGGFVVVEMPDARMQLVRVGERMGELKLRSVTAGEAVFDDPHGGRVLLRTPRVGSGVEPRP